VVKFSHDPVGDDGFLGEEFKYLKKHGYRYNEETMTAEPTRGKKSQK
jgi:hypothetical protein